MTLQYNLVAIGDYSSITVVVDGEMNVADTTHPNWQAIVAAVLAGNEDVVDMFDSVTAIKTKFEQLTERVSVKGSNIYFDGDPINGVLVDHILAFLSDGQEFGPLVNFLENVQQNPQQESREALYSWLHATGGFGITEDGLIVGYKGVRKDSDGKFWSISSGYAIVDGEEVNGRVPNEPGSLITMPRSQVAFDRSVACSTGLHIGTWEYARDFGGGIVLKVLVNPRDVVSVPHDSGAQKIRACAYTVFGEVSTKDTEVLFTTGSDELPEDEEPDNSLYATFEDEEEDEGDEYDDDEYDEDYDDDDEEEDEDYNRDCHFGQPGCDCAV